MSKLKDNTWERKYFTSPPCSWSRGNILGNYLDNNQQSNISETHRLAGPRATFLATVLTTILKTINNQRYHRPTVRLVPGQQSWQLSWQQSTIKYLTGPPCSRSQGKPKCEDGDVKPTCEDGSSPKGMLYVWVKASCCQGTPFVKTGIISFLLITITTRPWRTRRQGRQGRQGTRWTGRGTWRTWWLTLNF